MATTSKAITGDPDVLWIQMRAALKCGCLADAAEAQRKLSDLGITVRIDGLDVIRKPEVTPCTSR